MRAIDGCDRVDLHAAEALDRDLHLGHRGSTAARREALTVHDDAPGLVWCELEQGGVRRGRQWLK